MKKVALCAALAAGLAMVTGGAYAQGTTIANPNIIKVGIFRPTKSDVRDLTRSSYWDVGYERIIQEMPDSHSDVTVSVDWAESSHTDGSGIKHKGRMIPLLVNWRQHAATNGESSTSFYYGIGAGVYFLDGPNASGTSTTATRLGVAPLVGIEGRSWNAELKYHITGKAGESNMSGLAVTVGYRF